MVRENQTQTPHLERKKLVVMVKHGDDWAQVAATISGYVTVKCEAIYPAAKAWTELVHASPTSSYRKITTTTKKAKKLRVPIRVQT